MPTYQCRACDKCFSSKQKLEQHENRRFPCIPEETAYVCKCGKFYRHASSLSLHKTTCLQMLKPTTARALKYPITLNPIHSLDLSTLPHASIKERCEKAATETYRVEKMQKTTKRNDFIELACVIMYRVFLKPPNMIFYVPHVSRDAVLMYDGDTIEEISKKEMIDCVCDVVYSIIDDVIKRNDLSEYHPFVFIRKNMSSNFKTISAVVAKHLIDMLNQYSHDIKTVWRHAGLI